MIGVELAHRRPSLCGPTPMFEYLFPRRYISAQDVAEILEVHQMAQEFRQEVIDREQFAAYCDWYDKIALQHQQEWAAMQQDPHLLSWFWRR